MFLRLSDKNGIEYNIDQISIKYIYKKYSTRRDSCVVNNDYIFTVHWSATFHFGGVTIRSKYYTCFNNL